MKALAFALAALTLSLSAPARADDKAAKELEGTYKITSAEKGGKPAPKELLDNATVTIKGDEMVFAFAPDDRKVAKIKLAADAKPATIDLSPLDGAEKGKTFPGIYRLEKGELTLVFTEKGDKPERPKLLPADEGYKAEDDTIVMRLKKVEK